MKSIIRHGSTPPTSNDLDEYQLGFCNSNNLLYIKNANGEIVPLNDLQSIRNYIDESLGNGSSNKNEFVGTQEEWDALTAEEQNVYDIAYIKKSEVETSATDAKNSYSTEETLTGGTWIDGKRIYRKCGVYNNGETIETGRVLLDSTLTTSYVDTVIATGGSARGNMMLNIGGYNGESYRLCLAISDNGLIKLESDDTYKKFKWWIEYTKTTD